jgi:hypothetical protein
MLKLMLMPMLRGLKIAVLVAAICRTADGHFMGA